MALNTPIPQSILWHRTAPQPPVCKVMAGDIDVDVAIVGAGLTGLRTAIGLAEAGTKTAVLDAHQIGYGASGRSGGQCNPIWRATPKQLRERFGSEQAERLIQTTLSAADDLFDDIKRFDIDCGAEQNGWIQAAHSGRGAAGLRILADAWRAVGADIETVARSDVEAALGSTAYSFALRHAKGGFVQPMALTRGFAQTALRLGAELYENSPVTGLSRDASRWRVQTMGGVVRADTVILTTNAYTDGLWPRLKETLLPMVSIALATAPLSQAQRASVLPGRVTLSDTRLAIYYSRYDADHRLIFGCIGSDEDVGRLGGFKRLRDGLEKVFPQISKIEIECAWGGRIGVTRTMMPALHEPAPGILAGLGFSGRGIAMTSVMGRALARKVLGRTNADLPFPVTEIEPAAFSGIKRRMVPFMAPAMSILDETGLS